MKINIVLFEPEIPQNTGNIARSCAATGASLHLVGPMGFAIDDKKLKRAGLDYWYLLDIHYYDSIDEFFEKNRGKQFFYATTKGQNVYSDVTYPEECYLVFGKETKGIDEDILYRNREHCIRIPMIDEARSLNLSNSVAIVLYEALRQHQFEGLLEQGRLTKYTWEENE